MIEKRVGDLMSVQQGYLVHGCNAQGVMGSGVAKLIRDKYPEAYHYYRSSYNDLVKNHGKMPTGINIYASLKKNHKLMVVNSITQEFYGRDPDIVYVDYDAVEKCFVSLNDFIMTEKMPLLPKEVNFPLIGAGLANGDWNYIEDIIDNALDDSIRKILWTLE